MIVGITFGVFDFLYSGYINMLKEAKLNCDYLIVGLHSDASIERSDKSPPIQSVFERYLALHECDLVNEIIIYNTEYDLEKILRSVKVNLRIIGDEYRHDYFTGKFYCLKKGIAIHYSQSKNRLKCTVKDKIVEDAVINRSLHPRPFFKKFRLPTIPKIVYEEIKKSSLI